MLSRRPNVRFKFDFSGKKQERVKRPFLGDRRPRWEFHAYQQNMEFVCCLFAFSIFTSFDNQSGTRNFFTFRTSIERNKTTFFYMLGLAILTTGLSYAAVPLYRMFCQVRWNFFKSTRSWLTPVASSTLRKKCWSRPAEAMLDGFQHLKPLSVNQ